MSVNAAIFEGKESVSSHSEKAEEFIRSALLEVNFTIELIRIRFLRCYARAVDLPRRSVPLSECTHPFRRHPWLNLFMTVDFRAKPRRTALRGTNCFRPR